MIRFGEFLPDQPSVNNAGVTVATNAIPAANGYRSYPSFVEFSGAADHRIRGIFSAKDNAAAVSLFAGDQGKLYKFNQANSSLSDVSKSGSPAYDLAGAERWRFVQFGTSVIAAGGTGEELQKFVVGTDSAFSDLSSSAPKADFIAVVRDQVWTANIDEGTGRVTNKVRWSGINDETSWTIGTDQADSQIIPDAGAITGLVGGERAVILLERAIAVAYYVGSPLIYEINRVETQRGCPYPNSVANVGGSVFYLSQDGFYSFDGQSSQPIGAEKINEFFFKDFDDAHTDKMSAAVDPTNQIVCWSYVSNSSVDDTPDKILVYNYALGRWSILEVAAELIAPLFTPAYSLEALDNLASNLDSLPAPLDSSLYKGGTFFFGGSFDKKIFGFTGAVLPAVIETSEFALTENKHTIVTRSVPYFEDGSVTMQIGARDRQDDSVAFDAASSLTDEGFCQHRVQGRFHRARMSITGDWSFAQGVDIEGKAIGRR